jgi:hypothetical protein
VITNIADLHVYVALKHAISIIGLNAEVYLPVASEGTPDYPIEDRGDQSIYSGMPFMGDYNEEDRTGSVYNDKDHEYRYNEEPDFIARIAFLDPQEQPVIRGTEMFLDEENTAYTLKNTNGHRNYCPGDIVLHSKLLVHYGDEDLSYFVKNIRTLRNPNAKKESEESLIYLDLVLHV